MAIRIMDSIKTANDSTEFPVAFGDSIWLNKDKNGATEDYSDLQTMYNNDLLGSGGSSIQVDTMPIASVDELGKIYEFIGSTGTYVNGYFYECVSDGEPTPTYSWVQKNVQPNATFPVYTTAEYEQIKDTIPEGTKYIISDDYQGSESCNYKKEKIFEPSEIVVHSINHRGANTYAPENTMSAFRISKELGFDMVECDVDFTIDNIPVVIHDSTVDRTSNGTGEVHSFTFEDIRKLDFGSWKSTAYSGEKIPSFDEFILGCRTLGLHPYIEIKVRDYINLELVTTLVNIVHKYNMQDKVTWISFGIDKLQSVVKVDKYARVGFIEEFMSTSILDESINRIKTIDTSYNEIFYDLNLGLVNTSIINRLKEEKIKLEVWTVDSVNLITSADNYITGFTSNNLRADWVLRDALYADGDDLDFVDLTTLVQKTEYVDTLLYVYAKRRNGYVYMRCFATLGDVPKGEKYHTSDILVTGIPKKYIPYQDVAIASEGWGLDSEGFSVAKICRISVTNENFIDYPGSIRISDSNMVKGDKLRAEWIYPVTYHRK